MYYSQASSSGVVEEREKRSIPYNKGERRFMRRLERVAVIHVASWEVEVVHLDVCWKVTITSTIPLPYLVFTTITLSHTYQARGDDNETHDHSTRNGV